MTFYEERIRHLLRLFADNKATEPEIRELLNLLQQKEGDRELESFMLALRLEPNNNNFQLPCEWEDIWDRIHQSAIKPVAVVRKIKWLRVAAAIIIFFGIGAYFFTPGTTYETVKTKPAVKPKGDVMPGGNKAILTLANGSQIVLDSAVNGILTHQGNIKVIKLTNGQLVYENAGAQVDEVLYNTMSTPRGGQYSLILPDGSRVWLNAVSSIRFPTAFFGEERAVEIAGEAYFEIAKDPLRPFRVLVNPGLEDKRLEVSVLGTHFNINAYKDESTVKTTVLEGRVKVSHGSSATTIEPGEQTQFDNGILQIVHDANVSETVAWKDGRFEFRDTDLKTIMRQLMRWYYVDVQYNGNISERYFTADISRNKSLSGVLKMLELSDIDFKLEGNKLTVTP